MMLSLITIVPMPEKRKEILDILVTIKGPTLAVSGCLACCVCEEQGDEGSIVYLEKWRSSEELYRHIRSSIYCRILEAMELSRERPKVYFFDITNENGMELINDLRKVAG